MELARLIGITKSYPGVKALGGVDFDLRPGEIHCLVGENGAGKSTLMRVLTGATQPDDGEIRISGRRVALDPASALGLGIGIVHQELDLIPALSVAENIFLGHPPRRFGLIDRRAQATRAGALLEGLGVTLDLEAPVRDLPPALQQLVQIAKALSHDNRILILDEPTAALTGNEAERLFVVLERLRAQGLGLIYISHRLEEVRRLGDRLTVLRDGRSVMTAPVAGMSQEAIIAAMVGRPLSDIFPRSPRQPGPVVLSLRGLSRPGEFHDITLELHRGEVLALAGIVGAGRSELIETIFGLRAPQAGEMALKGQAHAPASPRAAIRAGIGLVPEERRETGLILMRSVEDNIGYPILRRLGRWRFDHAELRRIAEGFIQRLRIRTPGPTARSGGLSGGNQQKIVIGKWLAAGVEVLLLDEPTRGVDVNAKAEIYRLIDELAGQGVAILMASSELPEVLGISDRVAVLAQGRLQAILPTAETDQVQIMRHALGGGA